VSVGKGLAAHYEGKTLALAELAGEGLSVSGEFPSHDHVYSYGAASIHLTVDAGTGQVEVLDYFTIEDVGRVINPLTATGQLVGAVTQGLGGALLEQLIYDDQGQFLTGSFADYLMPTATDFPVNRAHVSEDYPATTNPLGAKGIGEGGTVPAGALVSNAVSAALVSFGVQALSLPLSPPAIWRLVQDGQARRASV
jgi:carbon-monoxide dehydrogenase large subunit